ncbi:unnamed protein product [Calypogeia fissa]
MNLLKAYMERVLRRKCENTTPQTWTRLRAAVRQAGSQSVSPARRRQGYGTGMGLWSGPSQRRTQRGDGGLSSDVAYVALRLALKVGSDVDIDTAQVARHCQGIPVRSAPPPALLMIA